MNAMYGPAAAPPPAPHRPGPGVGGIVLRVFFASFPVWSLGLLAWVPSLRFAVLRRRRLDWAVFAVSVALTVGYVVLLFVAGEDEGKGTVSLLAGLYIILLIGGATVHGILGDRFLRDPAAYRSRQPAPGYPAPHPAAVADAPTVHVPPRPTSPVAPPAAYGYPHPSPPSHPSPPPHPAAAGAVPRPPEPPRSSRMRQVASELDELDELLRRRDGGR
ncbi:hypothetical protein F0L17_09610 [Streptomyces sp. TRM43335]|uniref:Integral membrane protein n=1 Tax=Streptomyces taklimakanensis TaxID=2569853 RepID=A0A6G2BBC8_9ACTN|nr:hypothetical protein [Streptomyces taklimakanensis]MTE19379.1 hypothetical protein [Streptomyces taklimakanensis]